ncbi:MAG: serine--tRNA ligase [Deltaproteobacteria bacterium]|nr:serine--tRNA ligase [Deltaproteobacteria bacterium]
MLDLRTITEDPEALEDNLRRRNADRGLLGSIDRVVALANRRSELIQERDGLRQRRNELSRLIGQMYREGRGGEAQDLKKEVADGSARTRIIEEALARVEADAHTLLMGIPNRLLDDVPAGVDEEDNVEVRHWGEPRTFDFEPVAHVELGERLGILDFERSAKLAGARFWVLKGLGARLERALWNFFLDLAVDEHGFTEVLVPAIVHRHILEGTGQLPKFEEDLFQLAGELNGADAFLIPTAEVPVTNLHRGEILPEADLPLKYASFTSCFRSEAGAHGRDVRGLLRVHQFQKVEMVVVSPPEQSEDLHQQMVGWAEVCLQRLGLPYRVSLLCGGDTGFGAAKCYDVEVWLPSQPGYKEISSISNCGDFQARRMGLRYRPESTDGKKAKTRLPHTLNGSALAIGRTVVAILENYQQADGSVIIPEALRPYMGGVDRIQS